MVCFAICVLVNGIDVWTFKFTLDSEDYSVRGNLGYFEQQRYGSYILYYLLPFARYHIISQLFGLFMLVLAALSAVSRHNISNYLKAAFVILAVTFPNFAFLQYFYFQSAYNFTSIFIAVSAYRLGELSINKNDGKPSVIIPYFITAVLLLSFAVSSYQAILPIYLTVMMINIILDYILLKTSIRQTVKMVMILGALAVLAALLYYSLCLIISGGFGTYPGVLFQHDGKILNAITYDLKSMFKYLIGRHYHTGHTAILIASILFMINIIIYAFGNNNRNRKIFFIGLNILLLLAVFSLNIILNNFWIYIRASLSLSFFCTGVFLISYILCDKSKKSGSIFQYIIILSAIASFILNAGNIAKQQEAFMVRYENDKIIAADIMRLIYDAAPDIYENKNYNIAFIGEIRRDNEHPLIQSGKEVFKASFFWHSFGSPVRILPFLKFMGMPMNLDFNVNDEINEAAKGMPKYPDKNCVRIYKDTIIVNLE